MNRIIPTELVRWRRFRKGRLPAARLSRKRLQRRDPPPRARAGDNRKAPGHTELGVKQDIELSAYSDVLKMTHPIPSTPWSLIFVVGESGRQVTSLSLSRVRLKMAHKR
jgi:hypothetical protein